MRQRAGRTPVKGISRRVVIVPGEEDSVFEQIICVVKDDSLSQRGVTAEHILREAEELLRLQDLEEPNEQPSRLFSGVVLILMLIAFLLTAAILVYLHFHGIS